MANRKSYKHQGSQKTEHGNSPDCPCDIPEESEDEEEQEETLLQPGEKPEQHAEQKPVGEEGKQDQVDIMHRKEEKNSTKRRSRVKN